MLIFQKGKKKEETNSKSGCVLILTQEVDNALLWGQSSLWRATLHSWGDLESAARPCRGASEEQQSSPRRCQCHQLLEEGNILVSFADQWGLLQVLLMTTARRQLTVQHTKQQQWQHNHRGERHGLGWSSAPPPLLFMTLVVSSCCKLCQHHCFKLLGNKSLSSFFLFFFFLRSSRWDGKICGWKMFERRFKNCARY